MGFSSPLGALWNSPEKPPGPGLLCVGSFLISVSTSSGVTGLFSFLLLLHSVLEDYIFLEMSPFHLGSFKFLGIQFFIVISYNPLYFGGISCSLCSFISDCFYLGPLSFFLMSLLKGLTILFIFAFFIHIYLLIMLLQLSHFFSPLFPSALHTPPSSIPRFSSCPWVKHISSLASTFPILFLPSPCLFSAYHLCY